MTSSKFSKAAAFVASAAVTLTSAMFVSAAPANAALTEVDYGLGTSAWGTTIESDLLGVASDRTAYSWIECTRLVGLSRTNQAAGVALPQDNPLISVSAVESVNRTFKDPAKNMVAAAQGHSRIARVSLGNADTPTLTIKGLESTSTAWADKQGKLHAKNTSSVGSISLLNLPEQIPAELAGPLNDLLGALDEGLASVLAAISENAGNIVIPGLGEIGIGFDKVRQTNAIAYAQSSVLRIRLYGPDMASGGGDDSVVDVGHSQARIRNNAIAGLMSGRAFGAKVTLLDGIVGTGALADNPLPCQGTNGKVQKRSTVGLNLGNAGVLELGAVGTEVYGKQFADRSAEAYTQGGIAAITLGPLTIKAIQGRANVKQNKAGKITQRTIAGSTVGEILLDGESQGGLDPKTAREQFPDGISIPGLAQIDFFVTTKGPRSVKVTAVKITLLDETPGVSTVELGSAAARIKRY